MYLKNILVARDETLNSWLNVKLKEAFVFQKFRKTIKRSYRIIQKKYSSHWLELSARSNYIEFKVEVGGSKNVKIQEQRFILESNKLFQEPHYGDFGIFTLQSDDLSLSRTSFEGFWRSVWFSLWKKTDHWLWKLTLKIINCCPGFTWRLQGAWK